MSLLSNMGIGMFYSAKGLFRYTENHVRSIINDSAGCPSGKYINLICEDVDAQLVDELVYSLKQKLLDVYKLKDNNECIYSNVKDGDHTRSGSLLICGHDILDKLPEENKWQYMTMVNNLQQYIGLNLLYVWVDKTSRRAFIMIFDHEQIN